MAPTTHFALRIVAILVILVAYLLPHRHTGKTGQRTHVTNSAVAPRH